MVDMMLPHEVVAQKMDRLFRVFAQADSSLARHDVKVTTYTGSFHPAPAWSVKDEITFNLQHIIADDFTTAEGVIALTGLNYHELAHVLFTPDSKLMFRNNIKSAGYHQVWNMLEDARIEYLLCGRWLAVAPYLSSVFMRFILSNDCDPGQLWPLAAGRKHLPTKVRKFLRSSYDYQAHTQAIEDIVDEYLTVVHPRDDAKAFGLVASLHHLLLSLQAKTPDFNGHALRPSGSGSGIASQEEQLQDQEKAKQADEDGSMREDDEEPDDGDSPDQDESDDDSSSDSAPSGTDKLRKLAQKMSRNAKSRRQVKQHVSDAMTATQAASGIERSTLPREDHIYLIPFDLESSTAARTFADELRVVVDRAAAGWEKYHPSGRPSMHRAMRREIDYNTVYDRWNPGNLDVFDIEVVVLYDLSSSMDLYDRKKMAAKALWVIRRAFEMVEGDALVTVLGYCHEKSVTLVDRGERAPVDGIPVYRADGGTVPNDVATEARRIFEGSRKKHKALFLVTDGELAPGEKGTVPAELSVQLMNLAGVHTVMLFIREDMPSESVLRNMSSCNCQQVHIVLNSADFVTVARGVVMSIMKGRGTGV